MRPVKPFRDSVHHKKGGGKQHGGSRHHKSGDPEDRKKIFSAGFGGFFRPFFHSPCILQKVIWNTRIRRTDHPFGEIPKNGAARSSALIRRYTSQWV